MKRMFLALPVPEEIEEETHRCRVGLPEARWLNGLHLTMQFLGDLTPDREEVLCDCLQDLEVPAFELRLGPPGIFPVPGRTVLWLQCLPEEPLRALKKAMDGRLARAGFRLEKRFQPHVTLARLHSVSKGRLRSYLLQFEDFFSSPFPVSELVLFSSVLESSGARHTPEQSFRLL